MSRTSALKEFLVLSLAGLVIVVGIYILMGLAVDWMIPYLSVDLEKKMARPFLKTIENQAGSPETEARLQQMIEALQKDCVELPYEFQIHVHESQRYWDSTSWPAAGDFG